MATDFLDSGFSISTSDYCDNAILIPIPDYVDQIISIPISYEIDYNILIAAEYADHLDLTIYHRQIQEDEIYSSTLIKVSGLPFVSSIHINEGEYGYSDNDLYIKSQGISVSDADFLIYSNNEQIIDSTTLINVIVPDFIDANFNIYSLNVSYYDATTYQSLYDEDTDSANTIVFISAEPFVGSFHVSDMAIDYIDAGLYFSQSSYQDATTLINLSNYLDATTSINLADYYDVNQYIPIFALDYTDSTTFIKTINDVDVDANIILYISGEPWLGTIHLVSQVQEAEDISYIITNDKPYIDYSIYFNFQVDDYLDATSFIPIPDFLDATTFIPVPDHVDSIIEVYTSDYNDIDFRFSQYAIYLVHNDANIAVYAHQEGSYDSNTRLIIHADDIINHNYRIYIDKPYVEYVYEIHTGYDYIDYNFYLEHVEPYVNVNFIITNGYNYLDSNIIITSGFDYNDCDYEIHNDAAYMDYNIIIACLITTSHYDCDYEIYIDHAHEDYWFEVHTPRVYTGGGGPFNIWGADVDASGGGSEILDGVKVKGIGPAGGSGIGIPEDDFHISKYWIHTWSVKRVVRHILQMLINNQLTRFDIQKVDKFIIASNPSYTLIDRMYGMDKAWEEQKETMFNDILDKDGDSVISLRTEYDWDNKSYYDISEDDYVGHDVYGGGAVPTRYNQPTVGGDHKKYDVIDYNEESLPIMLEEDDRLTTTFISQVRLELRDLSDDVDDDDIKLASEFAFFEMDEFKEQVRMMNGLIEE